MVRAKKLLFGFQESNRWLFTFVVYDGEVSMTRWGGLVRFVRWRGVSGLERVSDATEWGSIDDMMLEAAVGT
jgi:hypothetical protein